MRHKGVSSAARNAAIAKGVISSWSSSNLDSLPLLLLRQLLVRVFNRKFYFELRWNRWRRTLYEEYGNDHQRCKNQEESELFG